MLLPAPRSVTPQGITHGKFSGFVEAFEMGQWEKVGSRFRRRLQRKAWIFLGVFTEKSISALAIVDAGLFGLAFLVHWDRESQVLTQKSCLKPLAFPSSFEAVLSSNWFFRSGRSVWHFRREGDGFRFSVETRKLSVECQIFLTILPITAIAPVDKRPFNSTSKLVGIGLEGWIRHPGGTETVRGNCGVLDYSIGYPARKTVWNWTSLIGKSIDGKIVGINLVEHHNGGLENAIWWDGVLSDLSDTHFESVAGGWEIHTLDNSLRIKFFCEGQRIERTELGFFHSRLFQSFGRFEARFFFEGKEREISGFGIVEDHRSLW